VSVFEDQAGAEESTRMAGNYVKDNLVSLMPHPLEITAGEVSIHELHLIKLAVREVKQ
jgi:hypothetical protein